MRKDPEGAKQRKRQARAVPAVPALFAEGCIPPLSALPRELTLNQIYGWTPCTPDERISGLTNRLCDLRERPLADIDSEDVCFLLRHKTCVDVFLDQAIAWLEQDPLADMQYYPGDLLIAALDLDVRDLTASGRAARLIAVAARALALYESDDKQKTQIAEGLERLKRIGEAAADAR